MILLVGLVALFLGIVQPGECHVFSVSYYSAEMYPGVTADGSTTTWGALRRGEPIVAAGTNLPLGSWVWIEGLDVFRVADRGGLVGPGNLDVLVATTEEAIQRGRETRRACRIA